MNKPFSPVIDSLGDRPADREVIRRIVYIDPLSKGFDRPIVSMTKPGFFRTIFSALAHIPRNEPIGDDLAEIEEKNRRIRRISEVIEAADPLVEKEIAKIIQFDGAKPLTPKDVSNLRDLANQAAHAKAGYANIGYQKLKLRGLTERLANLIIDLAEMNGVSVDRDPVTDKIQKLMQGIGQEQPASLVSFLRGLDVDFRIRRLRFSIRKLNFLYKQNDSEIEETSTMIDELKATLYELIDKLNLLWNSSYYSREVAHAAVNVARNPEELAQLLPLLEKEMNLVVLDSYHDDVFSVMVFNYASPALRERLASTYFGFAFYDLLTFPILQWDDLAETNEILVDRISPMDARGIGSEPVSLRGMEMQSFGAFFNRCWREHDYLWGRLNAADRLIDIILKSVGERHACHIDSDHIRRTLFTAILNEEENKLTADPDLIAGLRESITTTYDS